MSLLRSEQLAEAWRARYVRGEVEADEMEAGIERALSGLASDEEWVMLAHERRLAGFREPQSLASVDSILKRLYSGPICR